MQKPTAGMPLSIIIFAADDPIFCDRMVSAIISSGVYKRVAIVRANISNSLHKKICLTLIFGFRFALRFLWHKAFKPHNLYSGRSEIVEIKVSTRKDFDLEVEKLVTSRDPAELLVGLSIFFPWKFRKKIIGLFPHGILNFHLSILPSNRGLSPVFWQLWNGDPNFGLTIHKVDQNFDTGPIVLQASLNTCGLIPSVCHIQDELFYIGTSIFASEGPKLFLAEEYITPTSPASYNSRPKLGMALLFYLRNCFLRVSLKDAQGAYQKHIVK